MSKFIVIGGSLIVAVPKDQQEKLGKKQLTLGFGAEVEMSEAEHKAVDPKGDQLVTPEAFADLKKAVEAHQAFLEKQKQLGASMVQLSPKLIASFAKLEAERLAAEALKAEALKKPTQKKEGAK